MKVFAFGVIFSVVFICFGFSAEAAKFIGTAQCLECHNEYEKSWPENPHSADGSAGCEGCHGAGGDHQESSDPADIVNPANLAAEQLFEVCNSCHDDKKKSFSKSSNGSNDVGCLECHSPHGSKHEYLLANNGRELCQNCHDKEPHHFIADKINTKQKRLECIACHKKHSGEEHFLKYKKEELCVHCHKSFY